MSDFTPECNQPPQLSWVLVRKSKCDALLEGGKEATRDVSRQGVEKNPRTLKLLTEEFFLCLMRLRQGFHEEDLAFPFKVSDGTISYTF